MPVPLHRCLALALSLAALLVIPAWAKSPPDKLVLEGPGLKAPVEITDATALSGFSPWDRGFIAWDRGLAPAPPSADPRYTVSFYLGGRKIFVLDYVPAPVGGSGLLYIPGGSDPAYELNKGTIIGASTDRWDPNGQWQYATAQWDSVLQPALRAHGAPLPLPGAAGRAGPSDLLRLLEGVPVTAASAARLWAIALPVLAMLVVSVWVLRRRRGQRAT